jgi:response regulator RpfG family c-di-GMP phosphodiesterase
MVKFNSTLFLIFFWNRVAGFLVNRVRINVKSLEDQAVFPTGGWLMSSVEELAEQLKHVEAENQALREQAQKRHEQLVSLLCHILKTRSPHLLEQSRRVSGYALATAQQMRLAKIEVEHIRLAGLFYNFGAISVPEFILNKPGRLTDDELDILLSSAIAGSRIFTDMPELAPLAEIIGSQNEWYDGSGGYPGQKQGQEIPLGARILAVCKVYDALTASRSYRHPMPLSEALDYLASHAGTQFDPQVVEAFKAVISEK